MRVVLRAKIQTSVNGGKRHIKGFGLDHNFSKMDKYSFEVPIGAPTSRRPEPIQVEGLTIPGDCPTPINTRILNSGYVTVTFRTGPPQVLIHRYLMGCQPGDGKEVDHIDGNKLNNSLDNLRFATRSQNNANVKRRRDNQSGYKGVNWMKKPGKWRAEITINKKNKHIGLYHTKEEAYSAYCAAAQAFYGEFARLE